MTLGKQALDTARVAAAYAAQLGRAAPLQPECGCYSALPEDDRWFCANTKPHSEFTALADLSSATKGRKPLRAWLPLFVDYQRGAAIRPMFRSYVFFACNPSVDEISRAWYAEGVRRVISSANNRPIPLPVGYVEALQARGRAGDGVIDERAAAFPLLRPGDAVKVLDGPFADVMGICQMSDNERVIVLLTMFGRETRTSLGRAIVQGI